MIKHSNLAINENAKKYLLKEKTTLSYSTTKLWWKYLSTSKTASASRVPTIVTHAVSSLPPPTNPPN